MQKEKKISFVVSRNEHDRRLDRFLVDHLKEISRSHIQRLIKSHHVSVDGISRKNSFRVSENDRVQVIITEPPAQELQPEKIPLDIIYEDEEIIVINKSSGMIVHPAAGVRTGTVVNALLAHVNHLSPYGIPYRPGVVHRLDKETSGLLAFAKTSKAHLFIAEQFKERKVRKSYIALVWGRSKQSRGEIDAGLGRDLRDRKKISTKTTKPRQAKTLYHVLEYLPGFTLLELHPVTGRTHQLRAHLKFIHHPIVGDTKYGGAMWGGVQNKRKRDHLKNFPRIALHASFLSFIHPSTLEKISFHSSLPEDFKKLISILREN